MKRILALALLTAGLAACEDDPSGPDGRLPSVGDRLQLNVEFEDNCANPDLRTGRVVAVTERAIVVADTANPANGFSDADYREMGTTFDQVIYPLDTSVFGEPSDVDKNGRVILFFTRAINDLTGPSSSQFVSGLVFARDLFPKRDTRNVQGCPSSNESELIYLLAPDPARAGGNVNHPFHPQRLRTATPGTMAHEFQHVLNAGRRLYVLQAPQAGLNEEVWLNEGLSHVAEELAFYQQSGVTPRQNVDIPRIQSSGTILNAANMYAIANFGRLGNHYLEPEQNSPYDTDSDDLATRGAAWQFLRYAADRRNGDDRAFFNGLLNNTTTGMANLRQALGGADPIPWFRDWAVSVYTDDAVAMADSRFNQPSWHYRSVLTNLRGSFPLKVRRLSDGATTQLPLRAGGAAYLRFGVTAAAGAQIRVSAGGSPLPGACTTVPALQVGQVFEAGPAPAQLLCVQGAGEYTLIPFHGSPTSNSIISVDVTATGIVPVVGPPNPSLAPFEGALQAFGGEPSRFREDRSVEWRVRQREQAMFGAPAAPSRSAEATPEQTYVTLVRTK
ncbi:MAG TPA: hypothetical protein VF263_12640 [Longimicrobiaceae bacterium]